MNIEEAALVVAKANQIRNQLDLGEPAQYVYANLHEIIEISGKCTVQPTWANADRLAGKKPLVGCAVQFISSKKQFTLSAVNGQQCCGFDGDDLFICYLCDIEPIETPAEREQREEDEFVSLTASGHDFSGVAFEAGIRAAYRTLKATKGLEKP